MAESRESTRASSELAPALRSVMSDLSRGRLFDADSAEVERFLEAVRSSLAAAHGELGRAASVLQTWLGVAPPYAASPAIASVSNLLRLLQQDLDDALAQIGRSPLSIESTLAIGTKDLDVSSDFLYLGTDNSLEAERFESALFDVLEVLGLDVSEVRPPRIGSWFRAFRAIFMRRNDRTATEAVQSALEAALFERPQASANLLHVDALAKLSEVAARHDRFVVLVGNLLFVKETVDGLALTEAMTLTKRQLKGLRANSALTKDPLELLDSMKAIDRSDPASALTTSEADETITIREVGS